MEKLIEVFSFPLQQLRAEFDVHQPPAAAPGRELEGQLTVGAMADQLILFKRFSDAGQEMVGIHRIPIGLGEGLQAGPLGITLQQKSRLG